MVTKYQGDSNYTWTETQDCSLKQCPRARPIDCEWGAWSECSVTCGPGIHIRSIATQPQFGGKSCTGVEEKKCIPKPCPVDCQFTWSRCSTTCGPEKQNKIIAVRAQAGGKKCTGSETKYCNQIPCATGGYGFGSVWTPTGGLLGSLIIP